ncbi:MAG: hypothetical protein NTW10_06815 [Bacteroidetes bacterium]|nr:hypothetical protein [Bacteroidota bacterium]
MKKTFFISEGILQIFIALGAIVSGLFLIIAPDGSLMRMPLTMLKETPFTNFLIPGIILFTINGLGTLISGWLSFRQHKLAGFAGIFFGLGLIIWIFVQVSLIGGGSWLQYLYFVLGLAELLLGIGIREMKNGE